MFVHLSIFFYGWVRIYLYIYNAIELRKIGCLFSFSYVSTASVFMNKIYLK